MTSDDEFLRRLKSIVNSLELWGNLADATAVEDAAARIRELEAELEELRGFYSKYSMIEHRLDRGTHVIVPVEPTPEMKEAGWDNQLCGGDETTIYQAMIRAAQPGASY